MRSDRIKPEGRQRTRPKRLEAVVLLLGIVAFGYAFTLFPKATSASPTETGPLIDADPAAAGSELADPSKFPHGAAMHSRLPCLLCHKRDDNSPTPKRSSGHMPCAGCHVQQFADPASPMCTICHLPGSVAVKKFPPLRTFNVQFDHGRHVGQTGCVTCHKSSRGGVAFSMPSGASAHLTCFKCHGPKTEVGGKNIGSCSTCHTPGRPARESEWAKAFTVNFSHQAHIQKGKMNCVACHTVRAGTARGRQVSAPLASEHFARAGTASCGACHNNKRAFGPQDFSNCKRCHQGKTFKF